MKMMCEYDEAFTTKEMLEETGYCANCTFDCENSGKIKGRRLADSKSVWIFVQDAPDIPEGLIPEVRHK